MRLVRLPRLARDTHGQDLVEYAVIAAFVALVAIVGAQALGGALGHLYQKTSGKVNTGANFTTDNSATTAGCTQRGESMSAATPGASDGSAPPPPQTDGVTKGSCK